MPRHLPGVDKLASVELYRKHLLISANNRHSYLHKQRTERDMSYYILITHVFK